MNWFTKKSKSNASTSGHGWIAPGLVGGSGSKAAVGPQSASRGTTAGQPPSCVSVVRLLEMLELVNAYSVSQVRPTSTERIPLKKALQLDPLEWASHKSKEMLEWYLSFAARSGDAAPVMMFVMLDRALWLVADEFAWMSGALISPANLLPGAVVGNRFNRELDLHCEFSDESNDWPLKAYLDAVAQLQEQVIAANLVVSSNKAIVDALSQEIQAFEKRFYYWSMEYGVPRYSGAMHIYRDAVKCAQLLLRDAQFRGKCEVLLRSK